MKRRLSYNKPDLKEITDALNDPFRGWYTIYGFRAEKEPDFNEIDLNNGEITALVIIDIGAYRARDLDENALLNVSRVFEFFDKSGIDIILRIAYDREGRGVEHEPSVLIRVLKHIDQLAPIIQKFRNRIVFLEGMLVGSWGEMHGSKFLSDSSMNAIEKKLSAAADGIFRAVRTPAQWRVICNKPPFEGCNIALFNDAVFGSPTDLGTYAAVNPDREGDYEWTEAWPLDRELEFESALGEFAPQCGEAIYDPERGGYPLEEAAKRLKIMHMSCLNGKFDMRLLNYWRGLKWKKGGVWQGMNGYDYIGRHLGYRFCVRDSEVSVGLLSVKLSVTVENIGFAGFYQDASAVLIVEKEAGWADEYKSEKRIKFWKSGQKETLAWEIPRREGKIYLTIKRDWDQRTVHFANPSDSRGYVILGSLTR